MTILAKTMRYYNENDFLTVKDVSNLLKLSELTIYKYIRAQKLEAIEFGGHYRIGKSSLSKFIEFHIVKNKKNK
ncbi:MAG TPA: helix-turn-helix domain-containing protein [Patescibacteria group bacterium]|nr:helix-turn-helix domain-containing protein [Patescibacteria group bacterium]